jgi:hypothetical protein
MAVKAVNNTAGPNGLVLTLLVFRAYPCLLKKLLLLLSITARGAAVRKAIAKVRKIKVKR